MTIKKILKSVSAIALSLVVGVSLVACGSDDAKSYIEGELKTAQKTMKEVGSDLKDGKAEGANKIPGLSAVVAQFNGDKDSLAAMGSFAEKMSDFDFDVEDVKEDGDTATATVKIKTYNFGETMKKGTVELEKELQEAAQSGKSPEEIQKMAIVKLFNYVAETPKEKDLENSVTLNMKKVDGKWALEPASFNELTKALTGGLN